MEGLGRYPHVLQGFAGQNRSRNADIQSRYLQIGCRAFHLYRNDPANREQIDAYLTSIWGQVTNDVAESRKISVDSLNAIADRMLMFYPAAESVQCGLVDTLIYKNDVRNYLKAMVGIDKDDRMPVLGLQDMINVKKNVPKDKSGNVIAVYYAYGEIDGGSSSASSEEGIDSKKVIKDLRKLKDDEDVKAVVLRVNSPAEAPMVQNRYGMPSAN